MNEIKFADIWNTLSKIDCSGHTEKKQVGGSKTLTYLSWTWAWAELMKRYPDATYTIREWDGKPWLNDPVAGVLVMTSVNIGGNERKMWLAAMDGANNALKEASYTYTVRGYNGPIEKKVDAVDMCAINKAIMRCLVKNLAMFGLGLNIYAGEDLPVGAEEDKKSGSVEDEKSGSVEDGGKSDGKQSVREDKKPAGKKKEASAKMKKAWGVFSGLEVVKHMTEVQKTTFFKNTVSAATGKIDPYLLTDEEWDKVLARLTEGKAA